MRRTAVAALFWGACWGFAEATVGYMLHRAAVALPGLPGFLMFPVGVFFMMRAFDSTGRADSAFLTACVAAAVKLTGFLVPGHDPIRIINPALSLLMEGLSVAIVIRASGMSMGLGRLKLPASFAMGFAWRAAFLVHLRITSLFGLPAALATGPVMTAVRFLVLESAVNAIIIGAFSWTAGCLEMKPLSYRPSLLSAALVFAAAAAFQAIL
jgi:hypothetical protein